MTRHPFRHRLELEAHAPAQRWTPEPLEALVSRELDRPLGQPLSPEARQAFSDPVYISEMADRAFDRGQAERLLEADAAAFHASSNNQPVYRGR